MATPSTTVTCGKHPKRPSVARCINCETAVCSDCLVPTSVGMKCRNCTGVKPKSAKPAKQVGTAAQRGAAPRSGDRPRWLVPAGIAAIALVALVIVRQLGGDSSTPIDAVGRTGADDVALERRVQFLGEDNLPITGTFTLPASRQPVAGVLLVPGFGTVDRDRVMIGSTPGGPADRLAQDVNVASSGATDSLYVDLAKTFHNADIATLRYDKRGLGQSPVTPNTPAITYAAHISDARSGLELLSQRIELDGKPIILVGYDQGAVTAMNLASGPRVAAVVLVSAPARNTVEVLSDHFTRTHPTDATEIVSQLKAIAATLASGGALPARDTISGHLRPMFPDGSGPYVTDIFKVAPLTEARKVKVPALVLRGSGDLNVTEADAAALLGVLPAGSELQVAIGGDHNLASNGVQSREFLNGVAAWVTSHLHR